MKFVRFWRSRLDRAIDSALTVDGARPDYAEFALTLFAFIHRLRRELDDRGATQVLFCAREGQFLTRLFEHHNTVTRPGAGVEATYFLVSRRATLIASLDEISTETFEGLRASFEELTNAGFLHSLGLTGATSASPIDRGGPFDLVAVRSDDVICKEYETRRVEQQDLLCQYIAEITPECTSELHVVDVGWRGSIQDHLTEAVRGRWAVNGYYLGLVAERPIANLDAKTPLVFGPRIDSRSHYRVLKHFKAIWEYVLAADHGSVAGYRHAPGGGVAANLDPNRVEVADYEQVVSGVQRGLFDVFDQLCSLAPLLELDDDELQEFVARRHARMLFFPTQSELEIARSRGHYANFGNPWIKEVPIDHRPNLRDRIKNAGELVANPRILFKRYPPLELHRMGLDVLIPIVGTYRRLREFPPWRAH